MTASTLTPRLAAAVQDDSAGATGVVRQVVDGLLALPGDHGRLLYDRSADPQEPLRVYADPAGHPFCIFVA